jgi:hypothetical protein
MLLMATFPCRQHIQNANEAFHPSDGETLTGSAKKCQGYFVLFTSKLPGL